jgi:hypothetical protein
MALNCQPVMALDLPAPFKEIADQLCFSTNVYISGMPPSVTYTRLHHQCNHLLMAIVGLNAMVQVAVKIHDRLNAYSILQGPQQVVHSTSHIFDR